MPLTTISPKCQKLLQGTRRRTRLCDAGDARARDCGFVLKASSRSEKYRAAGDHEQILGRMMCCQGFTFQAERTPGGLRIASSILKHKSLPSLSQACHRDPQVQTAKKANLARHGSHTAYSPMDLVQAAASMIATICQQLQDRFILKAELRNASIARLAGRHLVGRILSFSPFW